MEGIRGHILNYGKTAPNTCIIMLRLSLAKPGSSAIVDVSYHHVQLLCQYLHGNCYLCNKQSIDRD